MKRLLRLRENFVETWSAWRAGEVSLSKLIVVGFTLFVVAIGVILVWGIEWFSRLLSVIQSLPEALKHATAFTTKINVAISTLPGGLVFGIIVGSIALVIWTGISLSKEEVPAKDDEREGRKFSTARLSQLVVMAVALIVVVFLISAKAGGGALGTIEPRIGLVTVERSSDIHNRGRPTDELIQRAHEAAGHYVRTLREAAKQGGRHHRSIVELGVERITVSSPSKAINEILEAVEKQRLGYLVVAASPNDVDYRALLDALEGKAVTFIVRPVGAASPSHQKSLSIYPSPESEGQWLAQVALDQKSVTLAVIRPKASSEFERRTAESLNRVLASETQMRPSFVATYGDEEELKEVLDNYLGQESRPEFLVILDEGPRQRVAIDYLQSVHFDGTVGLTSRSLDYMDPREMAEIDFAISLPWPIERYFALQIDRPTVEIVPERESISCAAAFSAVLLAAYAHNTADTLRLQTLRAHLLSSTGRNLDLSLPLGAVVLLETKRPPHVEVQLKTLRRKG